MTFEPHPREYFAALNRRPELAPTRISGLRDKLAALARYGISQVVVERFIPGWPKCRPTPSSRTCWSRASQTRWLLVGEDFRWPQAQRRHRPVVRGRPAARLRGADPGRRPTSTAIAFPAPEVRTALAVGDLERARHLLGHLFHISGHVIHGQKLGRTLGFPTMNLRVAPRCAARSGIYAVQVYGLGDRAPAGRGQPGRAPDGRDHGRCCWRPTCSTRPSMLTVNSCESNSCTSCGTKKNFPISLP